jgi:hypothetical protein
MDDFMDYFMKAFAEPGHRVAGESASAPRTAIQIDPAATAMPANTSMR